MKKTIVSFILDETGSMQSAKQQTISGFNEYIETLRNQDANVRFTLTQFNSEKTEVVLDSVKLKNVPGLTDETYQPSAMTPLYDAIGLTIKALEKVAKKKDRVLVVIQTDGQENHSREYTRDDIFRLIQERQDKNWTFVFLGADQDAWLAGQKLGLHQGNVMSYTSAKTGETFSRAAGATVNYAKSEKLSTEQFWDSATDDSAKTV